MRLEDLRRDNIGTIIVHFPQEDKEPTGPALTFHEYCCTAFYLTCQSIQQLENSRHIINQGNNTVLTVGMWFISIEAFVNALLKIACRIKREDFSSFKGKDIASRLASLLKILELPKDAFYKTGIFQRLSEFMTFRNEIFHDRTWEGELNFSQDKILLAPIFF